MRLFSYDSWANGSWPRGSDHLPLPHPLLNLNSKNSDLNVSLMEIRHIAISDEARWIPLTMLPVPTPGECPWSFTAILVVHFVAIPRSKKKIKSKRRSKFYSFLIPIITNKNLYKFPTHASASKQVHTWLLSQLMHCPISFSHLKFCHKWDKWH